MYCPYWESTRAIWSNIPLCLQEFPRASPSGTPSGKGVYLTVYPLSRPNTETKLEEAEARQGAVNTEVASHIGFGLDGICLFSSFFPFFSV